MSVPIPGPAGRFFSLKKLLLIAFPLVLTALPFSQLHSEDITVTTYYPSPSGSYDALIAKRFAVGDVNGDSSINTSDIPSTNGYLLVSDKLGIGTATPVTKLDVSGSATSGRSLQLRSGDTSTSTDSSQIIFSYNGNSYDSSGYAHSIRTRHNSASATNNAIDFWLWDQTADTASTLGSKRVMTIEGTGNVGIGTTAPRSQLSIANTLTLNSNTASWCSSGKGIEALYSSAEDKGWIISYNRDSPGYKQLEISASPLVLNAASSGYVGVGTTSPSSPLEVYYALNGNGLWLTSPGYDTDSLNAGLRFHSTSNSGYQGDVVLYHRGSSDPGLDIWGYPANSTPSCCVCIAHFSNAGNVGIGIAAPTSNLHVYDSTVGSYTDNALKVQTPYGYATFGSLNTSWFHISTDRPAFYFNNPCQANGGFSTYSSREKKQDIKHLSDREEDKVLESLSKMQMARFRYKDERFNKKVHLGIIAEESPDQLLAEDTKAIDLVDYISYAVTAIKAQQRQIKAQQAEINELKAEVCRLRRK